MIRKATLSDLDGIVKLHIDSYQNHFLSKLGVKLLKNYYKEFLENTIFLVSVNNLNEIEGFIVGVDSARSGRRRFVKNNILELLTQILYLCIKFDRLAWNRVWDVVSKPIRKLMKNEDNQSYLLNVEGRKIGVLSICVSNRHKGRGLSRNLMNEFEKLSIKAGYTYFTLAVYKSNTRAVNFYKNINMETYGENCEEYYFKKNLVLGCRSEK